MKMIVLNYNKYNITLFLRKFDYHIAMQILFNSITMNIAIKVFIVKNELRKLIYYNGYSTNIYFTTKVLIIRIFFKKINKIK